jgi:ribosomal protein S18 acetylase RimI-like enzyme
MQTALHLLNNPIWQALSSRQSHLALGNNLARRFPDSIGPLSGMADQSPEAYEALAQLVTDIGPVVLFLDEPLRLPSGWVIKREGPLTQMVCEQPLSQPVGFSIEPLTDDDIPEMLALTELTQPGPFREQTIDLGGYIGIRQDGTLVAMAGERLKLDGYTEISAVCTHPDYQGRGYAKALLQAVGHSIQQRGDIPFLHAWADNAGAIRVYEKLGFRQRRIINVAMIRPGSTE